jgi:hypothetical protein
MHFPVDPIVTKDTENKTNKDKSPLLGLFLIVFLFILLLPFVFFVFLFIICTIIVLAPIWVPFAGYKSFPNKYIINTYCQKHLY